MNLLLVFLISIQKYEHIPKTVFGKFIEDNHVVIMVLVLGMLFIRLPLGMWLQRRENIADDNKLHYKLVGILYLVSWWKVKIKRIEI